MPFQPRLYCPNQRPLVDLGGTPRTNLATDAVAVNGSSVVKALMSSVAHSGLALGPLLTKKASPAFWSASGMSGVNMTRGSWPAGMPSCLRRNPRVAFLNAGGHSPVLMPSMNP